MDTAFNTFKCGQTVYHYLDVDCEHPMTVVRCGFNRTQVVTQDDNANYISYRTDDLWRG